VRAGFLRDPLGACKSERERDLALTPTLSRSRERGPTGEREKGHGRVLVFANDRVESRMVPLPAPVRARFEGPVKDEGERHKRMQTTLDEGAGAEIVGQANTRVHQGIPIRNLAAYVERLAGKLAQLV